MPMAVVKKDDWAGRNGKEALIWEDVAAAGDLDSFYKGSVVRVLSPVTRPYLLPIYPSLNLPCVECSTYLKSNSN